MSEKLKPCPFCGHSAALESVGADHFVMCDGCCAETARFQSPTGDDRRAIEHAIAAWNKRAQHAGEAPTFIGQNVRVKSMSDGKIMVTMLCDAFEPAPQYAVQPINPAAVRAAPQPAALPEGWQPIETAPNNVPVIVAAELPVHAPGDWHIKIGALQQGHWRVWGAAWIPSHWMPLPAAPQPREWDASATPPAGDKA